MMKTGIITFKPESTTNHDTRYWKRNG